MRRSALPAFLIVLASLSGCGGGGDHSETSSRSAKLAVSVTWPSAARLVPNASQSVKLVVSSGTTVLATQTVVRPTTGVTASAMIANLPAGTFNLQALAYPSADGTGVAQAEGDESIVLKAHATTTAPLTMDSTVATLDVTPSPLSVTAGSTANATVSATDASGNVVLLALGDNAETVTWSTDASGVATVAGTGPTATVTGVAAGTATLTASLTKKDNGTTVNGSANVTVAANHPVYRLNDLTSIVGGTGEGSAKYISPDGQSVTGTAPYSFLYRHGTVVDLDQVARTLGLAAGAHCAVADLSANGTVLGYTDDGVQTYEFLYTDGLTQKLGSFGRTTPALALNDAGQLAGYFPIQDYIDHAFLYTDGAMRDLGTLGGYNSLAADINDRGQIVGYAQDASHNNHAFLYDGGTMQDLGTLGGTYSAANAINHTGQIVGYSGVKDGTDSHAFFYSGGTMQDISPLGGRYSEAYGINAKGEAVGMFTASNGAGQAFLYTGGKTYDLNDLMETAASEWTIVSANGIADDGTIAATAYLNGHGHAVLLTPVR